MDMLSYSQLNMNKRAFNITKRIEYLDITSVLLLESYSHVQISNYAIIILQGV